MKDYSFSMQDSGSGNFPPPPSSNPPPPPSFNPGSGNLNSIIHGMTGDMSLVGIVSIITGALYCLSCIGALVGVPLIFAGLRLRESADAFRNYAQTNSQSELDNAIQKQSRYFFIQKIFIIIALVFFVIYVIFMIFLFATGAFKNYQYQTLNLAY